VIAMATTSKLVLLRHGQSTWNELNQFTGWVDVPLTDQGRKEAARAGELLKQENLLPDVVYTSLLRRAITTANLALESADRQWIPTQRSWRLNERHYGVLQGMNKAEVREAHGDEKFMTWRRSYDTPPPMLNDDHEFSQYRDERYALLGDDLPRTECLKDVVTRLVPYWYDNIVPDLAQGKTVLVVAHGNSLRALVKHLEGISDDAIAELNLPTGVPFVYDMQDTMRPATTARFLDPEAAAAGAAAVAAQGK
jgi:2,3-bisphosphoglycerate-dependent phosphoglycerate mutase